MHSSQTLKVLRERWKRGLLYAICNQLTPVIHVHTFFKQIVKNKCPWCPHVYKNMVKVPAWTPLCWNMLKCPQGFSSSGHVPSLQCKCFQEFLCTGSPPHTAGALVIYFIQPWPLNILSPPLVAPRDWSVAYHSPNPFSTLAPIER